MTEAELRDELMTLMFGGNKALKLILSCKNPVMYFIKCQRQRYFWEARSRFSSLPFV
ncbi:MAG: hypothetical protein QNJ32_06990 [Xenococcaceae cyanobacterium MO_167.B27]|nr:hypothetical protein [Xenococcaceae cyanobacterium MO_167.B27]